MYNTAHLNLPMAALADYAVSACSAARIPKVVANALVNNQKVFNDLLNYLAEDVVAFIQKNPASTHSLHLTLAAFPSIHAVLHHRIASALRQVQESVDTPYVYALCNRGRDISGVEIHPDAMVGRRLVIDHGIGTVIGQTSDIGDDCYILNGVILGARGIADNPPGKRHPTLGSMVQVGAFARILGPITIGDNVFIAPHAVVTENIPDGGRVNIITQMQIESSDRNSSVFGRKCRISGYSLEENTLTLYGVIHEPLRAMYVDDEHAPLEEASIVEWKPSLILLTLPCGGREHVRRIMLIMPNCRITIMLNMREG